jgi:hypothetical protein
VAPARFDFLYAASWMARAASTAATQPGEYLAGHAAWRWSRDEGGTALGPAPRRALPYAPGVRPSALSESVRHEASWC